MQHYLTIWVRINEKTAFQLLNRRFSDAKIRGYAVGILESLSDEQLALCMLQLVQQLKFEQFHDSALSRFLMRRSLLNKSIVGHVFFWQLKV